MWLVSSCRQILRTAGLMIRAASRQRDIYLDMDHLLLLLLLWSSGRTGLNIICKLSLIWLEDFTKRQWENYIHYDFAVCVFVSPLSHPRQVDQSWWNFEWTLLRPLWVPTLWCTQIFFMQLYVFVHLTGQMVTLWFSIVLLHLPVYTVNLLS